jgi:aryl-alcohol dehydrogenase-like predicted oxidoreductase
MKTHPIGSLNVSVVGVGCNNFGMTIDERRSADVVHAALASGINFFDTADIYGGTKSEEFLGKALAGRRHQAVIATKFGMRVDASRQGGARPDYIRQSIEGSLKRLGTDRIDLYQLHTPDPKVPIADTLGALGQLVKAGKVREIGCSNFSAEQLRAAHAAVKAGAPRFVSVQNQYSLLHREPEAEVLPTCDKLRLAFLPYFPLANGLLTGKYQKGTPPPRGTRMAMSWAAAGLTERNFAVVDGLRAIAQRSGRTLLELAISWLLRQQVVSSVIAGATSPEQVRANAQAGGWQMSTEDLSTIDQITASTMSA